MKKCDYKEEANKLKKKRKLAFKYIKYYSEMAEYYEEKLSKQCENLKEYQDAINEILDRLENNTFKNEIELLIINLKSKCMVILVLFGKVIQVYHIDF